LFRLEVPKSPKPSTHAGFRSIRETPDIAPTPITRCLLVCPLRQACAKKICRLSPQCALQILLCWIFCLPRSADASLRSTTRCAFPPLELGHRSAFATRLTISRCDIVSLGYVGRRLTQTGTRRGRKVAVRWPLLGAAKSRCSVVTLLGMHVSNWCLEFKPM